MDSLHTLSSSPSDYASDTDMVPEVQAPANPAPPLARNVQLSSFFASFALGWLITNGAGLASYPIDTVRRRMMMTSGEAVKCKSSLDAFSQILKNEGPKSLFKGNGADILRAVAGADVLAGYDKLQMIVFGKKYGSGAA
ncbi:hypothetical protein T459_34321 [Capsicum annuum]|uniref:ADP/ATP translocase n=1 Tax=Capsicum annuum TaxID=4072 RepID=A0A2G2XWH9_CAPAN|nr:hypothetical protein T459_34321 [Capsicum annuum]